MQAMKILRMPLLNPHWQSQVARWRTTMADWLPGGAGRRWLWSALIALVLAVLVTLVWLAGRYEARCKPSWSATPPMP